MKPERGNPAQRRAARKDAPGRRRRGRGQLLLEAIADKEGLAVHRRRARQARRGHRPLAQRRPAKLRAEWASATTSSTTSSTPCRQEKVLRFLVDKARSRGRRPHPAGHPLPEARPRRPRPRPRDPGHSTARLRPRPLTDLAPLPGSAYNPAMAFPAPDSPVAVTDLKERDGLLTSRSASSTRARSSARPRR